MKADDPRWVEVTPSQFTHEAEGLRLVREFLPAAPPYRAWSNFEFRDSQGRWHEVDLLVLGRGRLHLVELKYYRGLLGGDDHRWVRDRGMSDPSVVGGARRAAAQLAQRSQQVGRTAEQLAGWPPEPPRRGRRTTPGRTA